MKTKTIRREVLRQSEAYTFSSGDRFGLTPDSHWYEITTFSGQDTFPNPLKSRSTGKDGNQIESGGCKNIIPVSDTDDDSVKLSGSIDDSNQPDSTTSLSKFFRFTFFLLLLMFKNVKFNIIIGVEAIRNFNVTVTYNWWLF